MATQHVNLPEFARRAGIPYPTMHTHWREERLPRPSVSADDNGGSALWTVATADKWIKDQGSTPIVNTDKVKPMPARAKASTFDIVDEPATGKAAAVDG